MKTTKSPTDRVQGIWTVDLGPALFGLTCVLLALVLFTAKLMTDDIMAVQDQGREIFSLALPVAL